MHTDTKLCFLVGLTLLAVPTACESRRADTATETANPGSTVPPEAGTIGTQTGGSPGTYGIGSQPGDMGGPGGASGGSGGTAGSGTGTGTETGTGTGTGSPGSMGGTGSSGTSGGNYPGGASGSPGAPRMGSSMSGADTAGASGTAGAAGQDVETGPRDVGETKRRGEGSPELDATRG